MGNFREKYKNNKSSWFEEDGKFQNIRLDECRSQFIIKQGSCVHVSRRP